MSQYPLDVVFVHGWSVTSTDTYGGLPERLVNAGHDFGLDLRKRHLFLGRYVSFRDEVLIDDIAKAMESAVADLELGRYGRFLCVTHSTGGPVVREWFDRFYAGKRRICPMSHLVMLAPANFGSALAQLGKGRLGRIKAWFGGVEPGQGVLDWLELGSAPSFETNKEWIKNGAKLVGPNGYFPFVVTGQTIDRKAYDHLNSYTGETGSDGVVRVASANLRSSYVCLRQYGNADAEGYNTLRRSVSARSPDTPIRIVSGKSHSGDDTGIMRSIKNSEDVRSAGADVETLKSILRCISVRTIKDYDTLAASFESESDQVQEEERIEIDKQFLARDRVFIHDRYSQIVFRVLDAEGHPIDDFDLLLTAGDESDPDHLPAGFFCDRQRNSKARNTITFFVNYDVMAGYPEIPGIRGKLEGTKTLGFVLRPRPEHGFVHYRKCRVSASSSMFKAVIKPNQTTLVEIVLTREIDKETFRLERTLTRRSFKGSKPTGDTVD